MKTQWIRRNAGNPSRDRSTERPQLGYVLQSPASWEIIGYISANKGSPYEASPFGAKSYQSAYWAVGNHWVSEALYLRSPRLAAALTQAFAANPDPTMEYYAPDGNPQHGFGQNLESPIGSTAFAIAHPDLFLQSTHRAHVQARPFMSQPDIERQAMFNKLKHH
jgi:hypothetical protein